MTLVQRLTLVGVSAAIGAVWGYRRGWRARSRAMHRLKRRLRFNREVAQ